MAARDPSEPISGEALAHTVTLELKLVVSRQGMADVTTELLDGEVDHMVAAFEKMFPGSVESVQRTYTTRRQEVS